MTTSLFGGSTTAIVNVNGTLIPQSFVATAGQTVFNITAFNYVVNTNSLLVFINGQKQQVGRDFTETSVSSFTLTEGCVEGDNVDIIGFPEIDLTSVNAESIFYIAPSGGLSQSLTSKLAKVLDATDYGVVADYNLATSTGTDNYSNLVKVLSVAAATKRQINFPAGVIGFSQTLTFVNGLIYQGQGGDASAVTGTTLCYTGASHGIQIINALNSFTNACIQIRDMLLFSKNRTVGKATLVDVGSSYLELKNVAFGANDYCLILDQTELFVAQHCNFTCAPATAGAVWCVDGPDNTPGASVDWTNTLAFRDCNFGGALSGTTAVGLTLDGGINYVLDGCQFTGFQTQIRVAGIRGLRIYGGEYEGAMQSVIKFAATRRNGVASPQTPSAEIRGAFLMGGTAGTHLIDADAGSLYGLTVSSNTYQVFVGGALPINLTNISILKAYNNFSKDNNTGTYIFLSNYIALGYGSSAYIGYNTENVSNFTNTGAPWNPAWTAAVTNPALGNGTLVGTYSRHGPIINVGLKLTIGSTTTLGSGQYSLSLPIPDLVNTIDWWGVCTVTRGTSVYRGLCKLAAGGNTIQLFAGADGAAAALTGAAPIALTNGDIICANITYTTWGK